VFLGQAILHSTFRLTITFFSQLRFRIAIFLAKLIRSRTQMAELFSGHRYGLVDSAVDSADY
jgi:hypothetical protein